MEYDLGLQQKQKDGTLSSVQELLVYTKGQRGPIFLALFFVLINSGINVIGPMLIGDATDEYIPGGDIEGLTNAVLTLFSFYLVAFVANFLQIRIMGKVGQDILFKLRNQIFEKLQLLPLAFFNANKSGDLISRINSDTDKLNQAFSEVLLRFIGQVFIILGVAISVISINRNLASIVLGIALCLLVITGISTSWIKSKNKISLDAAGRMSGDVQESLSNFKVIVAFGRRDYMIDEFEDINDEVRQKSAIAGIANGFLTPIFDLGAYLAALLVLIFGIQMLFSGEITFGVLLSFIIYTERFFQPLRILAGLFTSLQTSIAAWTRVSHVLKLKNNLLVSGEYENSKKTNKSEMISFHNVDFGYLPNKLVLKDISFTMSKGKTYAFVGPTGGGKSTTASLIARLYDVSSGQILLDGRDIRTYTRSEIMQKVGFILQDPFLFTGTIAENIKYGNPELKELSSQDLIKKLNSLHLSKIIDRFRDGIDTQITSDANSISIGQKQLIAFLRALLREPKILILDEASANIDTITENLLDEIIDLLPKDTTKIIIAHRLNTIEKADEIFFVAGGSVAHAGSLTDAMNLINSNNEAS